MKSEECEITILIDSRICKHKQCIYAKFILIEISWRFFDKSQTDNKSALIQAYGIIRSPWIE